MKGSPARRGAALALRVSAAALLCAAGSAGARAEELEPWQLVRSLQLLQDRIADGDQAALPMQRRLLAMTDTRLREATRADLADVRNFDAAMVYAMGGGNPATVQALMPDLLAVADRLDAPPPPAEEEAAEQESAEDEAAPAEEHAPGGPDEAAAGQAHGEAAEGHGKPAAGDQEAGEHGEPAQARGAAKAAEAGTGHEAADAHGGEDVGHAAKPEPSAGGHGEAAEEGHGGKSGTEHGEAAEGHGKPAAGHDEGHGGEAAGGEEPAPAKAGQKRGLALGVLNYGRGRFREAGAALGAVDPMRERAEVGAYVALIKGSLAANSDPGAALAMLDTARLIAPGTLVEEAALRRSVALAATLGDRPRFLRASGQYVRRFLRSPYASQFADGFVAGAVVLHEGLDLDALGAITAGMTPEQERVVYLRMARRAAIDNLPALSAYASAKAGAVPGPAPAGADPRAALYAALPEIATPDTTATLARLEAIDPKGLTASDRALLDAAKAVIGETLAAPPALPPAPAPPRPPEPEKAQAQAQKEKPLPAPETSEGEEPLEAVDDGQAAAADAPPEDAAAPAGEGEGAAGPAADDAASGEPGPAGEATPLSLPPAPDAAPGPPDAADAKVAETRKALEAVDRMLEDSTE